MFTQSLPLLALLLSTTSAHKFPAIKRQTSLNDVKIEDVCFKGLYTICPGNQYCCPVGGDGLDSQCVPDDSTQCVLSGDLYTTTISALDFQALTATIAAEVSDIAAALSSDTQRITGSKTTTTTETAESASATNDSESAAASASQDAGSQATTPTPTGQPGSTSSAASAQATSSSAGVVGLPARNKDILFGGVAAAMFLL